MHLLQFVTYSALQQAFYFYFKQNIVKCEAITFLFSNRFAVSLAV